jgi:pilus assembly protein Flp/PilA
MNTLLLKAHLAMQSLLNREDGQDLVEYALVLALVAFGATAGMSTLAQDLNLAFNGVGTTVNSYVS